MTSGYNRSASNCRECQTHAQFDTQATAWLDIPIQPRTEVWTRIWARTSEPALSLWVRPTTRKDKMKRNIITSTAAAAALTIGFGLISQNAMAATPKAKFIAMKKKVFASANTIPFSVKLTKVKSAPGVSWFVVDGQLVELANDSYTFRRSDGSPSVASVPGVLPVGVPLKLDLNESHYDSIKFGKDQNELVLSQKGKSNMRYVVQLDQKTSAPTYLTLQKSAR